MLGSATLGTVTEPAGAPGEQAPRAKARTAVAAPTRIEWRRWCGALRGAPCCCVFMAETYGESLDRRPISTGRRLEICSQFAARQPSAALRPRRSERTAAADRLDKRRIIVGPQPQGDPLDQSVDAERERWFAVMADRELDRAYRLAGLILGSFNDAEDATHDAFERAWHGIDGLRDRNGFAAWFDRILVNVCRDRLRRARIVRFVPVGEDAMTRPSADPYEQVVREHDLVAALGTLDADLRVVVVLRFWADLPVDEIAARVGIPAGTVKSRLNRAVSKMRGTIDSPVGSEAAP
jgi:RNA polymerase sigma factor (sigma-70 family)